MFYIYKITNQINGKSYIGFTDNPKERWSGHRTSSLSVRRPLYEAMRKYGRDNFSFEVIYSHSDKKQALLMEARYIAEHNTYNKGYNLTKGGEHISDKNRKITIERMTNNNPMKVLRTNRGSFTPGHRRTKWSPEQIEKARQSKIGLGNPNYANTAASAHLNEKRTECPHCGTITNHGNFVRWHGDKCKKFTASLY